MKNATECKEKKYINKHIFRPGIQRFTVRIAHGYTQKSTTGRGSVAWLTKAGWVWRGLSVLDYFDVSELAPVN